MKRVKYMTTGVCTKLIEFELSDQDTIHNIVFNGGCPGNLSAISKLLEGQNINNVICLLEGNKCGSRESSCADQLVKAIVTNI